MVTRREFIVSTSATIGGLAAMSSCSSEATADSYENARSSTWHHSKGEAGDKPALLRELVRYATLAPSRTLRSVRT